MTGGRRVIGSEHVTEASAKGRKSFELLPGDIVTPMARESAGRLGVQLVEGPLEKPSVSKTGGAISMRRVLHRRSPKWISPRPAAVRGAGRLGKLGLIGTGGVGASIAHLAANNDICDNVALVDIVPGLAESVALDLNHASGISRCRTRATGGYDLALIEGSDVVVVTAGRPRTPGMSRADLIDVNHRVIHAAAEAIRSFAPSAIVIVVTNPLDEMTIEMLRATGFPREQVLGMAGTLDSGRFRNALAEAAGVTCADVEAIALGSHGDEMAPITSLARIKGRPLGVFLSTEKIDECVRDAITGGGRVVALRKTGSATLAPAHASIELIDHLRGARVGPAPVSVQLDGEYGIKGVVLGVPCHLGRGGLLSVVELPLTEEELRALRNAGEAMKKRLKV